MNKRSLSILTSLCLGALSQEALADGKQTFLNLSCDQCHTVTSAGIEAKMMGLELDGLGGRRDANSIIDYLSKGAPHPLPWTGSEEDLKEIANWLASL